jgi:hypothetical protein
MSGRKRAQQESINEARKEDEPDPRDDEEEERAQGSAGVKRELESVKHLQEDERQEMTQELLSQE